MVIMTKLATISNILRAIIERLTCIAYDTRLSSIVNNYIYIYKVIRYPKIFKTKHLKFVKL